MDSTISKWLYRHSSQEVCPWNEKFARVLPDDSPFRPREALGGKDARRLAHELLAMTQEDFSRAFRGSPMKRAKLRGLKRNAAVVLGNVGAGEDIEVLTRALDDPEPLVRSHAAWALGIGSPAASSAQAIGRGPGPPRQPWRTYVVGWCYQTHRFARRTACASRAAHVSEVHGA